MNQMDMMASVSFKEKWHGSTNCILDRTACGKLAALKKLTMKVSSVEAPGFVSTRIQELLSFIFISDH
jgi:hypothetical protein